MTLLVEMPAGPPLWTRLWYLSNWMDLIFMTFPEDKSFWLQWFLDFYSSATMRLIFWIQSDKTNWLSKHGKMPNMAKKLSMSGFAHLCEQMSFSISPTCATGVSQSHWHGCKMKVYFERFLSSVETIKKPTDWWIVGFALFIYFFCVCMTITK